MAFERELMIPISGRSNKARSVGYTLVQDNGLGLHGVGDLIDVAAQYIDGVQFPYGTCALYEEAMLRRKIDMFRAADIDTVTGGALMRIACWQRRLVEFLDRVKELGFTAVELFDWTGQMQDEERTCAITEALSRELRVFTCVVYQEGPDGPDLSATQELILKDLSDGSFKVLAPTHHGGTDKVAELLSSGVLDSDKIVWEPPRGGGQPAYIESLVLRLGVNVSMALREPTDIITAEAMRNGLKDKTMIEAYSRNPSWCNVSPGPIPG